MCDDTGDTFRATLYNVLLAPDLCNRLFSIIRLMNLVQTCLFRKGFCVVYFGNKEKMRLHYHILNRGNMHFGGKCSKYQNQRNWHLGRKLIWNYCTIDYDTDLPDHWWIYILKMFGSILNLGYIQTFFISCQISSMKKKDSSKNILKPKAPSKWFLWMLL